MKSGVVTRVEDAALQQSKGSAEAIGHVEDIAHLCCDVEIGLKGIPVLLRSRFLDASGQTALASAILSGSAC